MFCIYFYFNSWKLLFVNHLIENMGLKIVTNCKNILDKLNRIVYLKRCIILCGTEIQIYKIMFLRRENLLFKRVRGFYPLFFFVKFR